MLAGGHYTRTLLDQNRKEREKENNCGGTEEDKSDTSVEVHEPSCDPYLQEAYIHGQVSEIEANARQCIPGAAQLTPGGMLTHPPVLKTL
jgi:hypothetical protein